MKALHIEKCEDLERAIFISITRDLLAMPENYRLKYFPLNVWHLISLSSVSKSTIPFSRIFVFSVTDAL
jgi:hypothetical protein